VSNVIEAAGGLLPDADQTAVNLAAKLSDGQKIVVPKVNAPVPAIAEDNPIIQQASSQPGLATPSSENPLDLNSATPEQLDLLPGIGPTRAADIIAYRTQHGSFKNIDEIMQVSGIGQTTFDRIKAMIFVDNAQ
jgi:competence protein ComEA